MHTITLSSEQLNYFYNHSMRNRIIDITTLGGNIEYLLFDETSTTTVILNEEEQFYADMRNAIKEFEKEELEQKQKWWQSWFESYIMEGLY
jgi:hypothetical protein